MKNTFPICIRHLRSGFSLVETVLALGIMGLAITSLLGLLPHGIEMTRKAANSAAETRIVDTIVGQLSNMPYSSLKDQDRKELHFDDQGVGVDSEGSLLDSTYFARILVSTLNGATKFSLPGSNAGEVNLKRVEIQIVQTPLRRFNFETAPARSFTTVPVVLAPMAP